MEEPRIFAIFLAIVFIYVVIYMLIAKVRQKNLQNKTVTLHAKIIDESAELDAKQTIYIFTVFYTYCNSQYMQPITVSAEMYRKYNVGDGINVLIRPDKPDKCTPELLPVN